MPPAGLGGAVLPPNPNLGASCDPSAPRGTANSGVVKLTKTELIATLKAQFGAVGGYRISDLLSYRDYRYLTPDRQNPIQVALNSYPEDYSASPGEEFEQLFSREQLSAWLSVADALSGMFEDGGWATSFAKGACPAGSTSSEGCLRALVSSLGPGLFRRPVPSAEATELAAWAGSLEAEVRVRALVSRMLIAPDFMYRMAYGAEEEDTRVRLTSHEVAARVAYVLTNAPPDAELLKAANAEELSTVEALRSQARRIIRTDAAREALVNFFVTWILPGDVRNPPLSWGNFAQLPDTSGTANLYNANGLDDEYREELRDFVRHVVWTEEGTYAHLMTARVAFPRSTRTAIVYATDGMTADASPKEAPDHPGLLTRAAVLASKGDNPSPILRGVMVKKRVLCQNIPTPDFSIVATRQAQVDAHDALKQANFEIVDAVTGDTLCNACHQFINPIGFLFEAYNPLGMHDDVQRVVAPDWMFPSLGRDKPTLPAGVKYAEFGSFELPPPQALAVDGTHSASYSNVEELVEAIAGDESARACMTVRFFRHANRRSESVADACLVADVTKAASDQPLLEAFVEALVGEDTFWRAR